MKEVLLIALKLFAGENSVLCWQLFFLGGETIVVTHG